jgi:hypothetical protein
VMDLRIVFFRDSGDESKNGGGGVSFIDELLHYILSLPFSLGAVFTGTPPRLAFRFFFCFPCTLSPKKGKKK